MVLYCDNSCIFFSVFLNNIPCLISTPIIYYDVFKIPKRLCKYGFDSFSDVSLSIVCRSEDGYFWHIGLEVSLPLDDIEWTTDNLFMDIGDVECDESECHEGDTEYPCIQDDNEDYIGERELVDRDLVYYDDEGEYG